MQHSNATIFHYQTLQMTSPKIRLACIDTRVERIENMSLLGIGPPSGVVQSILKIIKHDAHLANNVQTSTIWKYEYVWCLFCSSCTHYCSRPTHICMYVCIKNKSTLPCKRRRGITERQIDILAFILGSNRCRYIDTINLLERMNLRV